MSQIVLATAGHIDHGKTSLINALTGISTDTSKEEISRGITIDLGYAHLSETITIIDVPGHEKFIKNMVAGAAGTHYALIVIAADDGIMPQTIEHIDILIALGVNKGFVAISKIDLVKDKEWLELVKIDIEDFFSKKVFEVLSINEIDNISGTGIEKVKKNILNLAPKKINKLVAPKFRMNLDRVFKKDGFGLIGTGTVINGVAKIGDEIEVLPQKEILKIRSIQTLGKTSPSVKIGDRAAFNLKTKKRLQLKRGDILASKGILNSFTVAIINLNMNSISGFKIKNKQRVKFYFGTSEVIGRITLCSYKVLNEGQTDHAIIKLEKPSFAMIDDKFIIRSYSLLETLAGGSLLMMENSSSLKKIKLTCKNIPIKPKERFEYLIRLKWGRPKTIQDWKILFLNNYHLVDHWIKEFNFKIILKNNLVYSIESENKSIKNFLKFLDLYYSENKFVKYLNDEIIIFSLSWSKEWLEHVKNKMISKNLIKNSSKGISKVGYEIDISEHDYQYLEQIEKLFINSERMLMNFQEINKYVGLRHDHLKSLVHYLQTKDLILEIGDQSYLHKKKIMAIIHDLKIFFKKKKKLSVSEFKILSGLTRKIAIPLLEYLDDNQYTKRIGNYRIIDIKLND